MEAKDSKTKDTTKIMKIKEETPEFKDYLKILQESYLNSSCPPSLFNIILTLIILIILIILILIY